ncbi:hypothetical protein [uncultured Sphingomonas sp.]|uniref:hypothetical protein n=1 Tax=uncultured Sphingomonas sp. TaxID=158754 RepID=UPI0035CB9F6E
MLPDKTTPDVRRSSTPLYIDLFAAQAMLAAILWSVVGLIGELPRNADNSMRAIYTIPTFALFAVVSGILLWKKLLPHRALRIVCWFLVGFAVLAIPATLADVIQRNGS